MNDKSFLKYLVFRAKRKAKMLCEFFVENSRKISNLYSCALPVVLLILYVVFCSKLGEVEAILKWVFISFGILLFIVGKVLQATPDFFAMKYGKQIDETSLPVPVKRYTQKDEDGKVFVDKKDLSEIIQYLYDVENFLERERKI